MGIPRRLGNGLVHHLVVFGIQLVQLGSLRFYLSKSGYDSVQAFAAAVPTVRRRWRFVGAQEKAVGDVAVLAAILVNRHAHP